VVTTIDVPVIDRAAAVEIEIVDAIAEIVVQTTLTAKHTTTAAAAADDVDAAAAIETVATAMAAVIAVVTDVATGEVATRIGGKHHRLGGETAVATVHAVVTACPDAPPIAAGMIEAIAGSDHRSGAYI
jgi:hypothetical protein